MARYGLTDDLKIPIAIGLTLAVVLGLFYTGTDIGLDSDVTNNFIMVMPGLFLFAVGAIIVVLVGLSIYALPAFTVSSIGLALLFEYMFNQGLISDQLLSGLSVGDIQLIIIVFGFLIGAIVGAVGSS